MIQPAITQFNCSVTPVGKCAVELNRAGTNNCNLRRFHSCPTAHIREFFAREEVDVYLGGQMRPTKPVALRTSSPWVA